MRNYRVIVGSKDRYHVGTEYVQCKVSKEFIEYWKDKPNSELVTHVFNMGNGEGNPDSPLINPDSEVDGHWWDTDDLEHCWGSFYDNVAFVCELDDDGNEIEDSEIQTVPYILYKRNAIFEIVGPNVELECWVEDKIDKFIPTMAVWQVEKGGFPYYDVETDNGGFNPYKLAVSVLDTYHGSFVLDCYYNGDRLDYDGDGGTTGKYTDVEIGWTWYNFYKRRDEYSEESQQLIRQDWKLLERQVGEHQENDLIPVFIDGESDAEELIRKMNTYYTDLSN